MTDRLSRARTTGVLAVLRAPAPESALEAAEAIIAGGITGIEVTYSTPDAPAVIRERSFTSLRAQAAPRKSSPQDAYRLRGPCPWR